MSVFLVNFASVEFAQSQKRLELSAKRFGVDIVASRTPEDLQKSNFFKENIGIFQQKRGFGYWLWKPFEILELLKKADENDIVVYSDAGVEIAASLEPLFQIARERQPIVAFGVHKHLNRTWTKRDCFIGLDCDSELFWNAEQWNGFFQVYRKTEMVMDFVSSWLDYCRDPRFLTDMPNQMGQENLPGFRDHRHDQSIFSLLCQKNNLEKFRDPSQWGNFLKLPDFRIEGEFHEHPYVENPMKNSPYGTLLNHHRQRAVPQGYMAS